MTDEEGSWGDPTRGRWVVAAACKVVHPYGEEGWRPLSSGKHEHWVEFSKLWVDGLARTVGQAAEERAYGDMGDGGQAAAVGDAAADAVRAYARRPFHALGLPWRTGRKLGRTIYAMVGEEPSDDDVLLGLVEDSAIASHICAVHNGEQAPDQGLSGNPSAG